ncbi:hypothetical protein LDG_8941 [Legionella drancourtii LLAP12]|uniref:Uncharacterized protein n=1 Tax=Legionella drancourtii LLAP12 TaxID=658187 RepID=G9EUE7_9GAMM|nr:hypothetical protein LDG_8941 [Legionella drancourtii LLAP12]
MLFDIYSYNDLNDLNKHTLTVLFRSHEHFEIIRGGFLYNHLDLFELLTYQERLNSANWIGNCVEKPRDELF